MKQLETLKLNEHGYLLVGIRDHYKLYKTSELDHPVLDYKTYNEVLKFIFIRIWYYMITELWIFNAPFRFGQFYIAETISTAGKYKDWAKTKIKQKLVVDYNYHSNGRKFYIKWNKVTTKMDHKTKYTWSPTRGYDYIGKRGLAKRIKECSVDPSLKTFRGHLI